MMSCSPKETNTTNSPKNHIAISAKIFREIHAQMPSTSKTHLVVIPSYNTGARVVDPARAAAEIWDPVWVMADFFEAPFEELMAVKHPTAWVDFELGKIDEPTFLDSFFIDGRSYDQQAFLKLFVDGYRWMDGVEDILGELLAAGVEMHALSNYPSWWQRICNAPRLSTSCERWASRSRFQSSRCPGQSRRPSAPRASRKPAAWAATLLFSTRRVACTSMRR